MNRGHRTINRQLLTACCSLITILCSLLFVMGCQDPVTFEGDIPEGKGTFSLALDTARTILPATPKLSDFAVFNLDFTPTNGGSAVTIDRTNANLSALVYLDPGTYRLVVSAYKDSAKNLLMARGALDGVEISIAKKTTAAVTLQTLIAGTGTFRWAITLPADVTANMTITPGNAGGTAQASVSLTAPNASGSRTLNAGPYSLTFNLEKPDREPLVWEELLYVYQNLESVFTFEFKNAHFVDSAYTVTYQYNDNFTSNQNQSVLHGDTLASPATPSRSGYAFAGWYTNSTFSNKWNFENPVIESFTLYARWTEIVSPTQSVTIEMRSQSSNGWSGAGLQIMINGLNTGGFAPFSSGASSTYRFSVSPGTVVKFLWVKGSYDSGCAFAVYYSDNPPSPAFNPVNGASVDTARIVLYKQYGALTNVAYNEDVGSFTVKTGGTPTVKFDANGGSGTPPPSIVVTADSSVLLPGEINLTRDGYTFGGWNTNAAGTGTTYQPNDALTPIVDVTLYARWDLLLTENIWGSGSGSTDNGVWYSFNVTGGTTYYVWWNDRKQGNEVMTSDVAVSALYSDGTNIFTNVDSGYTVPQSFTADRTGIVHVKVTPYSGSSSIGTFALMYSTNNARPAFYAVIFGANGGGTPPATQLVNIGSSITLPGSGEMSRNNFVFRGWNTEQNGTGTTYQPGDTFTPEADSTLYARWLPTYTVNFDANGGTSEYSYSLTGASITLPTGSFVHRTNYTFAGWNTLANGSGTTYQPGDTFTPTAATTLYAVWRSNYNINFNVSGGSGTPPSALNISPGFSITIPGAGGIYRDGYAFGAWNTNSSGTGTNYSPGSSFTPTSQTTNLYARWDLLLTENIWTDSSIISYAASSVVWHSFNVTSGTTYHIWWNDSQAGNAVKTLDVIMSAVYSDGSNIFTDVDSGYASPQSFTADRTGTVHVRAVPSTSGSTGTFGIVYSANSTRPAFYSVSFNANGGGGTVPAPITVQPVGSSITIPSGSGLSRSGYTFGGWNTNAAGNGTTYQPGDTYTPSDHTILHVKWIPLYTVSFSKNAGDAVGAVPSQTVIDGSSITLPGAGEMSRSGYIFAGWNTNADGMGTAYQPDDTFTPNSTITLYAQWIPLYIVTFSANEGSGEVPSQAVAAGSSIPLPGGGGLTRSGYAFSGWNTDAAGTGTTYQPGNTFTPNGNVTLYAKWVLLYTVTFNANATFTGGAVPPAQTVPSGSSITIPGRNTLTRGNSLFGCWNTNADGTGTNLYEGTSYTVTANTTLYARWDAQLTENRWVDGIMPTSNFVWYSFNVTSGTTYYIWWNDSMDGNSAKTLDVAVNAVYNNGSSVFTSTDAGWTTPRQFTADRTGTVHVRVTPRVSGSGTFALAYSTNSAKPVAYTVRYSLNEGSGTVPNSQTVQPGSSITLPSSSGIYRSGGYLFGGWNTNDAGTGTNYQPSDTFTPTADTTIYVKWNPAYIVTYSLNNGSGTTPNSQTVQPGNSVTLPSSSGISRSGGYIFGGWNTNDAGTGTNYQPGDTFTPTAHTTIYAKWNPAYIVTFSVNSGSGTAPSSQTVPTGGSITLPSGSALSRDGYLFGGWNTNAAGTGTNYNAGSSYTPTAHITLSAKWNPAYTVNFNANGGTSASPMPVLVGNSITLPSTTRSNSNFAGWYANSGFTGTSYSAGSSYTPAGNITLYAKWVSVVTFDINGGSGTAPAAITVESGSSITLPSGAGFSKTDYTFSGWNTNAAGTGINRNGGASYTPSGHITLYANWPGYTVTFSTSGASGGTAPAAQKVPQGKSITIPNNSGFWHTTNYFGGWNTGTNGTGTNYQPGDTFTPTADITLYVRWISPSTVTFSTNGATGGATPASLSGMPGTSVTLPISNDLVKSSNIFNGWNTKSDGTGTNYYAGESYEFNGNVTLYANWVAGSMLTNGYWFNGSITSASSGASALYAFNVTSGDSYLIWWNDSVQGNGTKTLSIRVSAYYHDGTTTVFTNQTQGWDTARSFAAAKTGKVFIRVTPFTAYNTGTFGIAYKLNVVGNDGRP